MGWSALREFRRSPKGRLGESVTCLSTIKRRHIVAATQLLPGMTRGREVV